MVRINQSEEDKGSELPDLHERYEFGSDSEDKENVEETSKHPSPWEKKPNKYNQYTKTKNI